VVESLGDLADGENPDPGRRKLYRERHAFQTGAHLGHRQSILGRKLEARMSHRGTVDE